MSIHKEFTVDLISNASIGIFAKNTMAKFRNQLAQPLQLDADWQVALASISFPLNFNNVNSAEIVAYVNSGSELDASDTRTGQLRTLGLTKVCHLKTKRSPVFLVSKERKILHIMGLFILATSRQIQATLRTDMLEIFQLISPADHS